MVLLCLMAHVMVIEIVCILLNICIIYEPKSSTAACAGAGLATNRAGGRGWIWARPTQTLHVKPHLPPAGSAGGVICSFLLETPPREDVTQVLGFWGTFFNNSDSSKLKALRRAVPNVHTNLSLMNRQ